MSSFAQGLDILDVGETLQEMMAAGDTSVGSTPPSSIIEIPVPGDLAGQKPVGLEAFLEAKSTIRRTTRTKYYR